MNKNKLEILRRFKSLKPVCTLRSSEHVICLYVKDQFVRIVEDVMRDER